MSDWRRNGPALLIGDATATPGGVTDARTGERIAPGELLERALGLAVSLQGLGIGPGARVAILAADGPDFLVDLFATWYSGACAVTVDPQWTPPEIERVLHFCDPAAVLSDRDAALPAGLQAPVLESRSACRSGSLRPAPPAADAPALVLFTSGTTGRPKGVVHSYASLAARIRLNHEHIGAGALRVSLCPLSLHFGHGLIGNTLTPLFAGGDVVLLPRPGFTDWASLGPLIDRHGITFLSSVPAMWPLIRELSRPPRRGTLQRVHVGSAPLGEERWRQVIDWCATRDVVNAWGITEAANWIAGASAREVAIEAGRVGRPWGGEVRVADASGRLGTAGEGELCVRSPALMSGYLHEEGPSKRIDADGWFHTGDFGAIDDSGEIRLIGRTGLAINRGGTKVQPEEVETLLESHPAVREACVFGIEDDLSGEQVAAALVLGTGTDLATVRQWCAQRLHATALPQRWHVLDALPRTARSKLDRVRVRALCAGADAAGG